jgi:hypothetical protein
VGAGVLAAVMLVAVVGVALYRKNEVIGCYAAAPTDVSGGMISALRLASMPARGQESLRRRVHVLRAAVERTA